MNYELFKQGPSVYIPLILLSLIITMVSYGIFPIVYAKTRKNPITKKKYNITCYSVNAIIMIFFIVLNGSSSGAPYLLWTCVFSSLGFKILKKKNHIEGTNSKEVDVETRKIANSNTEGQDKVLITDTELKINQDLSNDEDIVFNITENGVPENSMDVSDGYIEKSSLSNIVNMEQKPMDAESKIKHTYCEKCGALIDNETKKCNGCGKQYFQAKKLFASKLVIVMLVLSMGVNIYQFLQQTEYKNTLDEKNETIDELNDKVSSQTSSISSYKEKSEYFDIICRELSSGNFGYASSNFNASESVIVLSKNETNRKFTLTAHWPNGGNVSIDLSGYGADLSFDKNSWTTSTTMTVKAWQEGVTIATFSNDADSKTFKVLIIVTN